eukprot:11362522-Alexandrium_andersonii.AAC.1
MPPARLPAVLLVTMPAVPPAGLPAQARLPELPRPAGPRDAGLEPAPGSRPCSGTPPFPDAADMKLDAL